jgi:hypothetical protein
MGLRGQAMSAFATLAEAAASTEVTEISFDPSKWFFGGVALLVLLLLLVVVTRFNIDR